MESPSPPAIPPNEPIVVLSDSPTAVRERLQARLTETQQMIKLAGRLGQSLLEQQAKLEANMLAVEEAEESTLRPELQQRLADLEREYKQVVEEESSRALLMLNKASYSGKENSVIFSAQGSLSPTKPSRRVARKSNSASKESKMDFMSNVSQKLVVEVRELSVRLAEKDAALKEANAHCTKAENALEVLEARVRLMSENEEKYKDENWNLELSTQELKNKLQEAELLATRTAAENARMSETLRSSLEATDQLKQSESDLRQELEQVKSRAEVESRTLQKEFDNLSDQNDALLERVALLESELETAKQHAVTARVAVEETTPETEIEQPFLEPITPTRTPTASPIKGTPSRNVLLETETMKASLQHAQRMITTLKSTIHREQNEKLNLKRQLAEATAKRKLAPVPSLLNRQYQMRVPPVNASPISCEPWKKEHGEEQLSEFTNELDDFQTANEHSGTEAEAYRTGKEDASSETETEDNCTRQYITYQIMTPNLEQHKKEYNRISKSSTVTDIQNTPRPLFDELCAMSTQPSPAIVDQSTPFAVTTTAGTMTDPIGSLAGVEAPSMALNLSYSGIFTCWSEAPAAFVKSSRKTDQSVSKRLSTAATVIIRSESALSVASRLVTNNDTGECRSACTNSLPPISIDGLSVCRQGSINDSQNFTAASCSPHKASNITKFQRKAMHPGNSPQKSPMKRLQRLSTDRLSSQSSVQSFTSELNERFQLRNSLGAFYDAPITNPIALQDIMSTMIGDYMWKYTRKVGKGEFSQNRHCRYFWVHPYTRTLYWSRYNPSTSGVSEARAKSISIVSIQIVCDENIDPPGLHQQSIIINTRTRPLKFTAPTGHSHEMWCNALSHILQLAAPEKMAAKQAKRQRSFADSFLSQATDRRAHSLLAPRRTTVPARKASTMSLSRINQIFHSPRPRASSRATLHTVPHNSNSHFPDGLPSALENVRSCCNGKHDVSQLARVPARSMSRATFDAFDVRYE